jgi:hypothetical protein
VYGVVASNSAGEELSAAMRVAFRWHRQAHRGLGNPECFSRGRPSHRAAALTEATEAVSHAGLAAAARALTIRLTTPLPPIPDGPTPLQVVLDSAHDLAAPERGRAVSVHATSAAGVSHPETPEG